MSHDEQFRGKVTLSSFVCAILVMILHNFNMTQEVWAPGFAQRLEFLLSRGVAQVAVPLFFAMSGFLFYRNFSWDRLGSKLKRRFFTLVVPYLIWNAVGMLFFYFLAKLPFINTPEFSLTPRTVLDALVFYRYNGNFWFMFYLILLTYLSPLLYLLFKNKWVGLAALVLLALGYSFYTDHIPKLLFRGLIFYGLGAWLALHYRDKVVLANRFHWTGAVSFLLGMALLVTVYEDLRWYILARLLLLYGFFQIINLFPRVRVPAFFQCSFAIYAVHGLVLETFNKLFSFLLPADTAWMLVDYFLSPAITLVLIASFAWLLKKKMPKVSALLFGSR